MRKRDWRLWLLGRMPHGVLEDPFEFFVAICAFFGGIPLVLGHTSVTSIEAVLPNWLGILWGVLLTLGALITILGLSIYTAVASIRRRRYSRLLEKSGLWLFGGSSITYGVTILAFVGNNGIVPACLVFGFGLACFVKIFRLTSAQVLAKNTLATAAEERDTP